MRSSVSLRECSVDMATKTVGLTGRDYSTMAAYASYLNALSLAANEFCDVYNDGGPVTDSTTVTIGGYTANGFAVKVRAASGQGIAHNANKLTNALRYNSANGAALENSMTYADSYVFTGANLTIEGLQIKATGTGGGATQSAKFGNGAIGQSCIFDNNRAGYCVLDNSGGMRLYDCLIIQRGAGHGLSFANTNSLVYGCTIAGSHASADRGIGQPYGVQPVVKNTLVIGFANDFQNTAGAGSTNNATSKASFGGTGWGTSGQTSVSTADVQSMTAGSEDLRIKTGSTKLIGTGASGVSSIDIVGTTRTSNDIGCWAAPAGGGGTTSFVPLRAGARFANLMNF